MPDQELTTLEVAERVGTRTSTPSGPKPGIEVSPFPRSVTAGQPIGTTSAQTVPWIGNAMAARVTSTGPAAPDGSEVGSGLGNSAQARSAPGLEPAVGPGPGSGSGLGWGPDAPAGSVSRAGSGDEQGQDTEELLSTAMTPEEPSADVPSSSAGPMLSAPDDGGMYGATEPVGAAADAASASLSIAQGPMQLASPGSLSSSPIDPFANNLGRLEQYLVQVSAAAGVTVLDSAQLAVAAARREANLLKASIAQAAEDTATAVELGVERTVDLNDAEFAAAEQALQAARATSDDVINRAVDSSLNTLSEERSRRRQEIEQDVETRARSVADHARAEGDRIRREGDERGRRSYELGDETFARYRSDDKADKAREAIDELVSGAAERFRSESEQVAGDLAAGAAEMARVWRAEVPAHLDEIDAGHKITSGELESARTTALDTIAARSAKLQAELDTTRTSAQPAAQRQAELVRAQLTAARDKALAAIDAALAYFESQVAARAVQADQELATATAAQQEALLALHDDVGNLFDPMGMQSSIDAAFAAGLAPWLASLEEYRQGFHTEISAAENTFAAEAAEFRAEALGAIGTELERGATGLAAVVLAFENALLTTTDGCVDAIADALAQAVFSIATISGAITDTLAEGYDAGIGQLDQTAFNLRSSHAGALYELPKKLDETAKEAIKPWWRKALAFFGRVLSGIFWGLVDVVVWVVETLINIVWGFIWGEAVFPDAWGAGVVVFVADLVAGVLIYGDVRDVLKWGLINPVLRGQGYSWINALMIGASLIGIIPLVGDVIKAGAKQGIKSLIKRLGKELAEHLIKELGEHGAERLMKEMGEEAAEKLVRELGEEGFKRLLAELGEQGLIDATRHLGPELLGRLAKGLGEPALKQALEKLGGEVLKDVGTRLGAELLSEVMSKLGADTVKDIVERVGAAGLKDLTEHLGTEALQQLAAKLGGHALGDLAATIGAPAVKELASTLTADGLARLITAVGANAIKPLLESFTAKALADLAAQLSPELLGHLSKELGPKALKEISERMGASALRELTEEVGAALVKRIADDIGVEALSELVQGLGGKAFGNFAKNLTAAELKEVVTQIGAKAVADTVREVGVDVYVQMVRQGGAALARRIVLRADIVLRYGRGAAGSSAAADALANVIKDRTAVVATELRRLKDIANRQGLAAARAAANTSPIMSASAKGNIELFLRTTNPTLLQAYFGRAVQFASEPSIKTAAEASGAMFRQRGTLIPKEPDIILPLLSGRFAVLDWTSAAQAGKAVDKYGVSVVDVIIEIIHTGA